MHPNNRAERRHTAEKWQNKRRFRWYLGAFPAWEQSATRLEAAQKNTQWCRGRKQTFACGNRCMHAMITRWEHRSEVKKFRQDWKRLLARY